MIDQPTEQRPADEVVARRREPAAQPEQRARRVPDGRMIVRAIGGRERMHARDGEIERKRRRRAR